MFSRRLQGRGEGCRFFKIKKPALCCVTTTPTVGPCSLVDARFSHGVTTHPIWTVPELRSILVEREAQEGGRREGAHQDDFAAVGGGSCKLNVPLPAKATRGLMMRLLQDANYDSGLHHRPLPTIQGMDVSRSPQRLLGLGAQADQSQPKCAQ